MVNLPKPARRVSCNLNEDIDHVPAAAPVSEPQGSSSSDEFISVYI